MGRRGWNFQFNSLQFDFHNIHIQMQSNDASLGVDILPFIDCQSIIMNIALNGFRQRRRGGNHPLNTDKGVFYYSSKAFY